MKNLILISLFFLVTSVAKAQLPTVNELVSYVKKDVDQINTILISKNFDMVNTETSDTSSVITYAYHYEEYSEEAEAFLKVFNKDGYDTLISIEFFTRRFYTKYLGELLKLGAKKMSSRVSDEGIVTVYQTKNYFYVVKTKNQRFSIAFITLNNFVKEVAESRTEEGEEN